MRTGNSRNQAAGKLHSNMPIWLIRNQLRNSRSHRKWGVVTAHNLLLLRQQLGRQPLPQKHRQLQCQELQCHLLVAQVILRLLREQGSGHPNHRQSGLSPCLQQQPE